MTKVRSVAMLAISLMATPAFAEEVINQKGKAFSKDKVTISAGTKMTFINDDTVAHNVYTIVGGEKQDLGLQKPGEQGDITFDSPGRYRVRCAIHPKMKMTVTVE